MSERDGGDAGSQKSGGSGTSGGHSETSSQRSDQKFLKKRAQGLHNSDGEEADVLEQKRNVQEGVFACMYTLVRQTTMSDWRFAILRIVLEFLMNFVVAFNSSFPAWRIDKKLPLWEVVHWVVWRSPIARMYGYKTYVVVLYVMAAIVLLAVVGLGWLTLAMRKQEQTKMLRAAAVFLNIVYEIVFVMCYVAFFDYFTFALDCDFTGHKHHMYFKDVVCTSMPHLLHMLVALASGTLFFGVTALVVVASCDLDPVSRGWLASPAAYARLRILVAKAVFVIFANCLDTNVKLQALGMTACVTLIVFWNFIELPFYRKLINVVWTGLWGGVLVPCVILVIMAFSKDTSVAYHKAMTQNVLYAMFPTVLGAMALTAAYVWWTMRPARKFLNMTPGVKLSKVHKFTSVYEVERLARVMRKFDIDGIVDPDTAAFGETIIKAGMQTFPNSPHLLILYANFVLEVHKDGPAARTQLQLVMKQMPNLVERYQVFCTLEASKKLKDNQEGGMDLQAYIEFKRNFRAVLRVHKEVLLLQTEVWQMCMRSSLRVAQFDAALDGLEAAAVRANQVYKRVLERYPTNGKLLRCYGKFLEDVVHDQVAAARAYAGANRNGGANALLSLDLGGVAHGDRPDFLTSMSMEDDSVVVIDAEGKILMVSQEVQRLFGYAKTELEGANVSLLMPQPFSQRHPGYLARYVATGEARMLDSVKEVVALHKERYVFPVALCVTKLSGVGSDSIFLGLLRPLPPDLANLRAWMAPNGVFLCVDQQFASAVGMGEGELVGHSLSSLVTEPEAVASLLERCQIATVEELEAGTVAASLRLLHRYLDPVPVDLVVRMAGSDGQRILVLHCRRTDGFDGSLLAVDSHMRVRFASFEVAILLGYTMRKLATMRLDQILPQPHNALHAKWLRDPPHAVRPGSCRSGAVVHLLAETGVQVPVRITIKNVEVEATGAAASGAAAGTATVPLYAVQVTKVSPEELFREKRLVLTTDFTGQVLAVSPPDSAVFDFPSGSLVGSNLADCVDIFADWRQRSGEAQMQMILLALLGKEQEMPGTSWRVRLHEPQSAETFQGATGRRVNRSACLQVELEDEVAGASTAGGVDGGGGSGGSSDSGMSRILVKLWRRDLLGGVLELDEELVIRRASPLTGLITGLPTTAMLRKPLRGYLHLPHASSWDQLVAASHGGGSSHKKSALKATSDRGSISPVMAFVGPHPDSGTMRLFVQGVQTLGPGGRPKVTLTVHPDTTFVGAHADLMRVLKLDEALDADGSRGGQDGADLLDELEDDDEDGLGLMSSAVSRAQSAAASQLRGKSARRAARRQVQQHRRQQHQHEGQEAEQQKGREGPDTAAADGSGSAGVVERGVEGEVEEAAASPRSPAGQLASKPRKQHAAGRKLADGEDDNEDDDGDENKDDDRASDADDDPAAAYHRQNTSKSEFVEQWVRSVTKQLESKQHQEQRSHHQQQQGSEAAERKGSGGLASGGEPVLARKRTTSQCLPTVPEGAAVAAGGAAGAADGIDHSLAPGDRLRDRPQISRVLSLLLPSSKPGQADCDAARDAQSPSAGERRGKAGGRGDDAPDGGDGGKDDRSETDASSVDDGSQAASAVSGTSDASSAGDVMVDTRRARLLKTLNKLLLGSSFMSHVDRLRLHSSVLVGVMFLVHLAAYLVITGLLKQQHTNVYNVHRQAMAMDRSQLIIVRCVTGAYCIRANVTKMSSCARPLSGTLSQLTTNIALMEEYHQGVYLGFQSNKVTHPASEVYKTWTSPWLQYQVWMDTTPPSVSVFEAGVWQLGNRFLAAAREALYRLPELKEYYPFHRTYAFILANGLGPLFTGYSMSLEHLVVAAWDSILALEKYVIVILVVEAVAVLFLSTLYETYLVARVERARLLGVLAILGLPGPVLRQLAVVETKLQAIHDGDDDSDFDGSVAGSDDDNTRNPSGRHGTEAAAAASTGARGPSMGKSHGRQVAGVAMHQGQRRVLDVTKEGDAAGAGPGSGEEARPGMELAPPPDETITPDLGTRTLKVMRLQAASRKAPPSPQKDVPADNGGAAITPRAAAPSSGAAFGVSVGGGASRRLQINGKTLLPSYWNVSKFTIPLLLWNIAVVIIYVITLQDLKNLETPLASLNMASHVTYRYTRLRAMGAIFVTRDDSPTRALLRGMLAPELDTFEREYNALMYGGSVQSTVDSSATVVPAGTFASSSFAQIFFRAKRCFRYDQKACYTPTSEYYEVTHNGLDVMVRRMVSEMRLMTLDADQDVAYNSTRYTFMSMVAGNDLYEGLQQAAQLFVDYCIAQFDAIAKMHTILLVVSVGLLVGFFGLLLWPHLGKMVRDASRQSALLSMVPPEMDVRGHVRAVYRRAVGRVKKAAAQGGGRNGAAGSGPADNGSNLRDSVATASVT